MVLACAPQSLPGGVPCRRGTLLGAARTHRQPGGFCAVRACRYSKGTAPMTDPRLSVRPHAFPAAGGDAVRATPTAGNLSWTGLLARLVDGDDLSAAEARWAMREVALGNVEQAQLAGFLVALRCKGESPQELLGFLDALMQDVVPVPVDGHGLLDVVGTGGDGAHTVNVSTMAAIVAASSGARVLKHGGGPRPARPGPPTSSRSWGSPWTSVPRPLRSASAMSASASRWRHASCPDSVTQARCERLSASPLRSTTSPR